MATIADIIEHLPGHCDAVIHLKGNPQAIEQVAAPLTQAGLTDFVYVGKGTNAFFVAPSDNDKIVFRISTETAFRRDDVPFFLASPYEYTVKSQDQMVKLELLLAGKKEVPDEKKSEMLREMERAGWNTRYIEHGKMDGIFWRDVITLSLRGQDGRIKNIAIVSDPSASSNYLLNAKPPFNQLNSCSPDYITLQDQASAYNQAINEDPRLKKLVPNPIIFQDTTVLPSTEPTLPSRNV